MIKLFTMKTIVALNIIMIKITQNFTILFDEQFEIREPHAAEQQPLRIVER